MTRDLLLLVASIALPLLSLVALTPSREDDARHDRERDARRARRREARALARASRPSPVVRVVTYDTRWDAS